MAHRLEIWSFYDQVDALPRSLEEVPAATAENAKDNRLVISWSESKTDNGRMEGGKE